MTAFDPDYSAPAGLAPLVVGLLTTTHERHMDLVALVSNLPPDALTWSPGPDAAHISGLVMHILEVEEYLARVASGEHVEWDGTNGSSMDVELDAAALTARIAEVDARLKAAMEAVPEDRLQGPEPENRSLLTDRTVGSMLVEDLDHSAMHYGQVQLTRHLYELAHPEFQSTYEHWR